MTEVTERNPMAIRIRVLEEFGKVITQIATNPESWRKLSFEAHKELCKVLGKDFIDYPEFEFWFSRFARGDFDLNYDKSSDPKARSFLDLPWDTFEKVGEYLEFNEKLVLRNVCKDLRAHFDNWDPKVTKFWYRFANNWGLVLKPNHCCDYSCTESWSPEGIQNKYDCAQSTERIRVNRFRSGFYRNPMSFVMSVLKHPKLQLEELKIHEQDDDWKRLIRELDRSNRKLHVKEIRFPWFHSSKIDLHFMIPGVLEEIEIYLVDPKCKVLYKIIESEQCQAAKMVHIKSWTAVSNFPLVVLYNCPRFTLKLNGVYADGLKAKFLKTLMKEGKVQKCVLYNSENYRPGQSQSMKYFNEPEAMVPNFPPLRRYPIKGTKEYYELEYREEFVSLERKHQTHEMAVAIRGRILDEYRKVQTQIATNPESWRNLSFEAHKELCKVLDFVDYPEFEFWFLRFSRGDFDLHRDRSTEPKARSLTDLPFDIFEKIGGNLELHDRLLLRDVCKDIRYQVDNWDLKLNEIYYKYANQWRVWHTSRPGPYCADNFGQNENNRSSYGFCQKPISFVMSVLKHPKLQVEKLKIHEQDDDWRKLIKRLDASNRKLYVKNVEFPNRYHQSTINLNYMIPGVLEEIKIYLANPNHREIIEMIKSEQCQAAKMVYIDSPTRTSEFPLDVLYNCPRFTLKVGGRPADGLKSKFLKKLMNKGKVQECVIYAESQIMKYFDEPEAMVPDFPSLRRYPIPETNEYYELEYQGDYVRLERKK